MARARTTVAATRRVHVGAAAALVAALLLGACGGCEATAPDEPSRAGDDDAAVEADRAYFPGVGTTSLDVQDYVVVATVEIDGPDELRAEATLRITALEQLDRVELDLTGLTVDAVALDGDPVPHTHDDAKLVITPDDPIATGTTFDATITYHGAPAGGRDAVEILEDGGGWLDLGSTSAVLAEPIGASTWLPVNDLPSDKATLDLTVSVDADLEAVANGLPADPQEDDDSTTRTFRWRASEPMAPYLMTLVIGDLELVESRLADGTPVIDAVPPGLDDDLRAELARFPTMVAFLEARLGPYPFDSAGNVVVSGMPPTALETQTRSILSLDALREPDPDQLLVHELAHQWFGDAVTPATWADVWLNEGPAVYLQWSWAESVGGPTLEQSAQASWDVADASMDVPPANLGEDELFGRSVYERSAMFLIQLERVMGDDAFGRLLRRWLDERAGATGTTEQFLDLAARIHGDAAEVRSLADPWLFGDELPKLSS
jgi:aminopeptidase N